MSQIHLKLYNFSELEEEIMQRKEYKTDLTGVFLAKLEKFKKENLKDTAQELREEAVP